MSAFIVDIRQIKDTQQGKQIWPYRPLYIQDKFAVFCCFSAIQAKKMRMLTARGCIYMERTDATNSTCALIGDGIKEQRH